jgi:hypothetical protein
MATDRKAILDAITKAIDDDDDDDVIQGIHDASLCLGAGCLGPGDITDDDDYDDRAYKIQKLRKALGK